MDRRIVFALLAIAALAAIIGGSGTEAARVRLAPELQKEIESRTVHIDPGELLSLMNNNLVSLFILDVRDEADFNVFHLRDAQRTPAQAEADDPTVALPAQGVKVLVSNDEAQAEAAWKHLRALGVINLYILEGGINGWLKLYGAGVEAAGGEAGDGRLRYRFEEALGEHHPAAAPDRHQVPERTYEKKVKIVVPAAAAGGGCG